MWNINLEACEFKNWGKRTDRSTLFENFTMQFLQMISALQSVTDWRHWSDKNCDKKRDVNVLLKNSKFYPIIISSVHIWQMQRPKCND